MAWKLFFRYRVSTTDFLIAQLTAMFANVHRDSKKRPQPFEADDFLPTQKEVKKQKPDEMMAMMKAFAQVHNAGVKKRETSNGDDR